MTSDADNSSKSQSGSQRSSMKKSSKWILIVLVLAMLLGVGVLVRLKKQKSLEISYREIPVVKSDLEVTILSTGVVSPENRLEIKPPIPGRVEQVLVKEGQRVRKGQILAWMSSTERAAMLDSAGAKGPEELKKWEDLYRPTPIMAPINGTLIARNVESGQTFTSADSVFTMSDRLTVKAQVDETDIAQITLRQRAKIILDAYPNQTVSAVVDQIAYDAKTVNNVTTYTVDVLPGQTPASMRSGMTANVTFLVSSKSGVLTVPNDALKVQGSKYSVQLKSPEGEKPAERLIQVGMTDGKKTEILSGLSEQDVVLAAEIRNSTKRADAGSNPFGPMGGPPRKGSSGGGAGRGGSGSSGGGH
ncbi:MAG: efflux RND transporter periplasmic adaptor subunit [Methylotenera sp.]|nr:efflux RND transporter periplasmic adaptor subunit [Oligoflexia bacterium]